MFRFIWNSWWRNKERFILLLVGVLILSTGLSYLIGLTQANNATVAEELQKRWNSSYHIVVRPPESRSVTEELNLLEPNYLSGLDGGITLEQYEQIKALSDIEIAAPIAMMGYVRTSIELDQLDIQEPGVYRMNINEETDTGAGTEEFGGDTYFTVGGWRPEGLGKEYGTGQMPPSLTYGTEVMIAGIDPAAEAALVGIDNAIVQDDSSRFFEETDQPETSGDMGDVRIPVIISNRDYVDATMTYSFERLDFPFSPETQIETMEKIKESGGRDFLETQEGTPVEEYQYTTSDVHEQLIDGVLSDNSAIESASYEAKWMSFKPSAVNYQPVESPFDERWPYAYQVQPYEVPEESMLAVQNTYRPVNEFGSSSDDWPRLQLNYVGVFDPQQLDISKDPLTELPMETYFPAKAQWVMDENGEPINPPTEMKPLNNPYGFLTKPPLLLTTLEAAAEVLGEQPISAIRVNVKGVDVLDEVSEAKLQAVAKEIEETTGLITDVTLGSSPQLALTHLPGLDGEEALGWVQQPWIKLGSSITIFQETKVGMSGIIATVLLVAVVYVFASNIIMLFARKKEFAVLLALGWRPQQLSKLLFLESTMLGILVALISWLILGTFLITESVDTSAFRVFLIGVVGLAIYWLGSLIPIGLVKRIRPYESMRSGEVSHRSRRLVRAQSALGMSLNQLTSQWQRSVLSMVAIAVPTSLFIFFLFVTFRLRGVLYATWLGEFVALEVGTMHYVAMGVALLIAVLTTTEIMWQNVSERQSQIAVLKATGWRNGGIRLVVLLEGAITGLVAGIIGMGIALVIIAQMYGQFPAQEFGFLLLTLLIPVSTGILGAVLPAAKAVKIKPYQAINGTLHNSKKVEKQFKWTLGIAGAGLMLGLLSLFLYALPESGDSTNTAIQEESPEGTSGTLSENAPKAQPADVETGNPEVLEAKPDNAIDALMEDDTIYRRYNVESGDYADADFRIGEPVSVPEGLTASSEENKLFSIPVTFEHYDGEGFFTYKPQHLKVIDNQGNEYSQIDMKITEEGRWEHQYRFIYPGKMTTLLTYEVPKELERVALIAEGSFVAGKVVVEIPLSY